MADTKVEDRALKRKDDKIASEVERFIDKFQHHHDINEVTSTYDKWATKYDTDLDGCGYNGPLFVARKAMSLLGENKHARMVDICAGTGKIAEYLLEKGYTNIDAIDGSAGMRDVAMEKKLYRNYYVTFVTEDKTAGIEDNTYDCIVTSGSFIAGHLKSEVIPEFIRMTKPGGYICVIMREQTLFEVYKGEIECVMYRCMAEGKWKRLEREIVPRYNGDFEGVLFVHRKI